MSTAARPPLIAVCGTSRASELEYQLAFDCGALLADRGAVVVNGGLGGVMAAAAAGVASRGGQCIGLLPGSDAAAGDPALSVVLPTGLGEMRNALIARTAGGMIAVGGGWGTLSEIALARRLGKPVALLHSWELRAPGDETLTASLHHAGDAADAVGWVLAGV